MVESIKDAVSDPGFIAAIAADKVVDPGSSEPIHFEIVITQYPVDDK